MARPKEPRYEVLSLTRNVPGSLSLSSWIAVRDRQGSAKLTRWDLPTLCPAALQEPLLGSSRKSSGVCAKDTHIPCVAPTAVSLQGLGLVPRVPAVPRTLSSCSGHAV